MAPCQAMTQPTRTEEYKKVLKPQPEEPKPPAPLTKEELKRQKMQDRRILNMLKIQLQPIMDQIRNKFRKFRTGVIDEHQIRYLYDEADPGTVSSDLHTDLLAHASFRPYEIGTDARGEPGLLETGTGKFFYNLDTVTIEKRLSNGYYKRPQDFVADVRRLAKDARVMGDQERLLKANELLTNVEVDVDGIELAHAQLVAECEGVYAREIAREKEMAKKARKAAEEAGTMPPPPLISNVSHNHASVPSSLNPSTGPIMLGEPINDARALLQRMKPTTPLRPSQSTMTNGVAAGSEALDSKHSGSQPHDADQHADVERDSVMTNHNSHPDLPAQSKWPCPEAQKTPTTGSSSFGQSAQPKPAHAWTAPSQQLQRESGMSAPLSQKSAVTPMAPGSQAADYQNSASSTMTTSGKKNSGSTGEQKASQAVGPNLYMYDYARDEGDFPATLDGSTHHHQPRHPARSQEEPVHQRSASIQAILNSDGNTQASPPSQPDSTPPSFLMDFKPIGTAAEDYGPSSAANGNDGPRSGTSKNDRALTIDHDFLTNLHNQLTAGTDGCTVEHLEQINSVLMDTVWRLRGTYNRDHVAMATIGAFNKLLLDMEDSGADFGGESDKPSGSHPTHQHDDDHVPR